MSTIHPTPSGTRDVLPDEMREVHAIVEAVRGVFDARGYGEIHTPALEYEQVLTRGDPAAADPAYKLFDEQGNVLVLRSDMTIPIARVVSTRYATADPPLRFCYVAHAYRSVRPQRGQDREMLQAGIELVGVPEHEGTAETLTVLCEVLDAIGLTGYRVGPRRRLALPGAARRPRRRRPARARGSCTSCRRATSSAWSARSRACGSAPRRPRRCCACRSGAAGRRCSTPPAPAADRAARRLRALLPDAGRASA